MATDNVIDRLQDLLAAARAERDETEAGRTLTEPVLTALVEQEAVT